MGQSSEGKIYEDKLAEFRRYTRSTPDRGTSRTRGTGPCRTPQTAPKQPAVSPQLIVALVF